MWDLVSDKWQVREDKRISPDSSCDNHKVLLSRDEGQVVTVIYECSGKQFEKTMVHNMLHIVEIDCFLKNHK